MKVTEQYFDVVLFIMLCEVVLTFESVYEILKCDHSNESYGAVLSCGTVYLHLHLPQYKHSLSTRIIMLYKVVLTFESVGKILKCDHSNESH